MGFAVSPGYRVQPRLARILLVEDDPLLQEIFGSALALQGYEVETASNGLNALWKVREGRYDLVLCDDKLPEINGLAMARLVRDLVNTAARPALVALTGAPALLMDEALPGGTFDEIVAKPVDLAGSRKTRRVTTPGRARQARGAIRRLASWSWRMTRCSAPC